MVRSNSDVFAADDRLYFQQRNYIEARIAVLMRGVRLKDTAGEFDEEDVRQLNGLLDIALGG